MASVDSTKRSNRFKDLSGQTFGRWHVIEFHSVTKSGAKRWLCRCECGTVKPVQGSDLRDGGSTQCLPCGLRTHGQSDTPEYKAWKSLTDRCCKRSDKNYHNYGGRGITVCRRWMSFENFLADMGSRPSSEYSIDRIGNDGNYSCGHCLECLSNGWHSNCRWATRKEQARNRRTNHMLTHNGKTLCITDWAKTLGMSKNGLLNRLERGWAAERALTTPVRAMKRNSR